MPSKKQLRKDRVNRKKRNIIILVILVLVISIGFALLSSTHFINGVSTIKNSSWDVHFSNLVVSPGSVIPISSAEIENDKLNISYSVTLDQPGDYYEFTVDVVNEGTIDAKLSSLPEITGVSAEQDVYTNYSFRHTDNTPIKVGEVIETGASTNFKVRVEYDDSITTDGQLPKTDQQLDLQVKMVYEQV